MNKLDIERINEYAPYKVEVEAGQYIFETDHDILYGVSFDEEYSLRPFTMEELNARIDQAEAEIAAGLGIDDEDVWRELEEEFAREDAEEDAWQLSSYVEEEHLATV